MFTETLRIKVLLDAASAKSMEANLSQRFATVSRRFGRGLRQVLKGTFFGFSIGLLNRLLNPLEALEEKLKGLLGHAQDTTDLAESLGATPGQLKVLQDVAASVGLKPDQLKDVLSKFEETRHQGQKQLDNKFLERSPGTLALGGDIIREKNGIDAFIQFMTRLRAADSLTRQGVEEEVFGGRQFGGVKRLIETDVAAQAAKIHEPGAEQFNTRFAKTGELSKAQAVVELQRENKDFFETVADLNLKTIRAIEAGKQRDDERINIQLKQIDTLLKGKDAVDDIKVALDKLGVTVSQGFDFIKPVTGLLNDAIRSNWFKVPRSKVEGNP